MDGLSSLRNSQTTVASSTVGTTARADWTKPLIETLSKLDPDKAAALKSKVREADGIVHRIQAYRQGGNVDIPAAAQHKVDWITARLEALQPGEDGKPKATARELRQLSLELADATKAYAAAEGSQSSYRTLPTVAEIVATAKAALEKRNGSDAKASSTVQIDTGGAFAGDARKAKDMLQDLVDTARAGLKFYSLSRRDLSEANKALHETTAVLSVLPSISANKLSGYNFLA